MRIIHNNKHYTKRIDNIEVNNNEKTENCEPKIDNLINYKKKYFEHIQTEERKDIKENEETKRKEEKAYNFYSEFPQSNYLLNYIISNFILKIDLSKNLIIKIDENKLNENHAKNKDYNLLGNIIINKN